MTETTPTTDEPTGSTDEVIAVLIAGGATYREAGIAVGLSERSVQARMTAGLDRRVDEIRRQTADRALRLLEGNLAGAALEIARLYSTAEDEKTRLNACRAIFDLWLRARQAEELDQRLQVVTERLDQMDREKLR